MSETDPELPMDLIFEIIHHVSLFDDDAARCHTLHALCMVSREFKKFASSCLYKNPPPLRCYCPTQAIDLVLWKIKFLDTLKTMPHLTSIIESLEVSICPHVGIAGFYDNNFSATTMVSAIEHMTNLKRVVLRSHSPWNTYAMNSFFDDLVTATAWSGAEIQHIEWSSHRSVVEFNRLIHLLCVHKDTITTLAVNFVDRGSGQRDVEALAKMREKEQDQRYLETHQPLLLSSLGIGPAFPLPNLIHLSVSSWDTLDLILPIVALPGQLTRLTVRLPIKYPCIPPPVTYARHQLTEKVLHPHTASGILVESDDILQWKQASFTGLMRWLGQHPIREVHVEFDEEGRVPGWNIEDMAASIKGVESLTVVNSTLPGLETAITSMHKLHTLTVFIRESEESPPAGNHVLRLFSSCPSLTQVTFMGCAPRRWAKQVDGRHWGDSRKVSVDAGMGISIVECDM